MLKSDKKRKYIVLTAILSILMYFYALNNLYINEYVLFVAMIGLTLIGNYFVHKPSSTITNVLLTSIFQLYLIIGMVLTYEYFPNLSMVIRVASVFGFAGIFYILLLVNNVFLVVHYRNEVIPLYRVALTWSKIVLVVVSIPLLAGIFKLSVVSFVQVGLVVGLIMFTIFNLLWVLRLGRGVKQYKTGEVITLMALSSFIISGAVVAVSFMPSEAFLKGLFVASVGMFITSYVEGHFKNTINKKLLGEHTLISVIFLILMFIFTP